MGKILSDRLNKTAAKTPGKAGQKSAVSRRGGADGIVYLCTHHHSDLVWRRTREGYDRVRERQIINVLRLMRKFPDFYFTYAQAEVIRTFFRDHPELINEFKKLVKAGRIEIAGGILSIPDSNMVAGEALIRNFILGQKYFRDVFGLEVEVAWLMDSFGMCGQIPQILSGLGFKYLLPGRMPNLLQKGFAKGFVWEGIDGSTILTASAAAALETIEYVCNVPTIFTPEERIEYSLRKMRARDGNVFGIYCTEEDLLRARALSMAARIGRERGKPIVFAPAKAYFKCLDARKLPRFQGEFNPVSSGCYTTRCEIKQLYRAAEIALMDAERACAAATLLVGTPYPEAEINALWRENTLFQFHDAICGCHVDEVADDLKRGMIKNAAAALRLMDGALNIVAGNNGTADGVLIFNPLPFERVGTVELSSGNSIPVDDKGHAIPAQEENGRVSFVATVPALGFSRVTLRPGRTEKPHVRNYPEGIDKLIFETDRYQVCFVNAEPRIKAKNRSRNVLREHGFGEIIFRSDHGSLWTEAFHGSPFGKTYYRETVKEVSRGAVRSKVLILGAVKPCEKKFDRDKLWESFEALSWEKEYIFYRDREYFELKIRLFLNGKNTKVSVAFPVNVDPLKAEAIYDVPFGIAWRKPYYEVPAKYEFTRSAEALNPTVKGDWPALYWVDYSDGKGGLTVANRGTPGWWVGAGVIQAALLRSPTDKNSNFEPGAGAWENGAREFHFAFFPHAGGLGGESLRFGDAFNHPMALAPCAGGDGQSKMPVSLISWDNGGVRLSAFKQSADGSGVILRLYESLGRKCSVNLKIGFPVSAIWLADLAEKPSEMLGGRKVSFKAFEIKTLIIRPEVRRG